METGCFVFVTLKKTHLYLRFILFLGISKVEFKEYKESLRSSSPLRTLGLSEPNDPNTYTSHFPRRN